MMKVKNVGWGVAVVGALQLFLVFKEAGKPPEIVLAAAVLALGLWIALGKLK